MDLELILTIHVKRSQENGLPLTFTAASTAAVQLYEWLKLLGIYETNGQRLVNTEVLTQTYINYILNHHKQDIEINDVNDPHYENPNNSETNETLINSVTEYSTCLVCSKKVYNETVFTKHIIAHANNNVVAVAANIIDATAESVSVNDSHVVLCDSANSRLKVVGRERWDQVLINLSSLFNVQNSFSLSL